MQNSSHYHFHCAPGMPCTRTTVRLLGPCFKTGKRKPCRPHHQSTTPSSSAANRQSGQHQPQRPYCKQLGKCRVACTDFLRFRFSKFRYSLTTLSRGFASFPHGTCTLSVSHQYLALDGIYHPLELQSQTTRLLSQSSRMWTDGSLTLYAAPFQGTSSTS